MNSKYKHLPFEKMEAAAYNQLHKKKSPKPKPDQVPSESPAAEKAKKNIKIDPRDLMCVMKVHRDEFSLRERCSDQNIPHVKADLGHKKSSVKIKGASAETKSANSISPPKKSYNTGAKRTKKKNNKRPRQSPVNNEESGIDPFSRLFSNHMFILSPEMADIFGQHELTPALVLDAVNYVFLERNLFEPDRKYVVCDDELSKKLFDGKRRLQHDEEVKKYLRKHLTLVDDKRHLKHNTKAKKRIRKHLTSVG